MDLRWNYNGCFMLYFKKKKKKSNEGLIENYSNNAKSFSCKWRVTQ